MKRPQTATVTVLLRTFLVFLFVGFVFHAKVSFSQVPFSTGNGFLTYCEFERAECNNYIAGVADGMYATQVYAGINITQNKICIPEGTTVRQNKDIFVKYLQKYPEKRNEHTGVLFIQALMQAFPC